MRRIKKMSGREKSKSFTFSLIAGILIFCNASLLGAAVTWFPWIIPTIPGTSNDSVPFDILIAVGFLCSAIILLSSLILYRKLGNKKALGITIIAFSIPSVVMGGGFIIGFIVGIMGGVSALRKPSMQYN